MNAQLFKGILSDIATSLVADYRRLSVQWLKIEAAKSYLCGIRMARLSAIGVVRMGLIVALICVGTLIAHAALFILLPWSLKTKALVGLLLGFGYVLAGALALHTAMKESTWMEKSGATQMLLDATGSSGPEETQSRQ